MTNIGTILIFCSWQRYWNNNTIYKKNNKKTILVVGTGYAGNAFIQNIDKNKFNVKVITTTLEFIKQPRFINCIQNSNTYCDQLKFNKCVKVKNGIVTKINLDNDTVTFKNYSDNEINEKYDILVLAIGSVINTFGVNGVSENCIMFKTHDDLKFLNDLFKQGKINKSSKIGILGGGIVGIELASNIKDKVDKVTVIEMSKTILPLKDFDIGRNNIEKHLINQKINIKTNRKVIGVNKKNNTIVLLDGNKSYIFDEVFWTCGVKPHPLMNNFKLKESTRNIVDSELKIIYNDKILNNVYAIGDCNGLIPTSAQHAKQQGLYLAKKLNTDNNNIFKPNFPLTLVNLNNKVYIHSKYYNGFFFRFLHDLIDFINK